MAYLREINGLDLPPGECYLMGKDRRVISRKEGRDDIELALFGRPVVVLAGKAFDLDKLHRELWGPPPKFKEERLCPICSKWYSENRKICGKCYQQERAAQRRERLRSQRASEGDLRVCENPNCDEIIPADARPDRRTCGSSKCRVAAWRARQG